jgi:ubiquinone/menaquinone biosynthesis C-methylase UbiE
VLDVAAGTGNAALPAAETGAGVTASDLTPELLEAGRSRAESSGLELEWVEADAENLPFDDESFDVVMSSIGAMFAPHHQEVADELVRVCRPGGTIGLLSWTPEGMIEGTPARAARAFAQSPAAERRSATLAAITSLGSVLSTICVGPGAPGRTGPSTSTPIVGSTCGNAV